MAKDVRINPPAPAAAKAGKAAVIGAVPAKPLGDAKPIVQAGASGHASANPPAAAAAAKPEARRDAPKAPDAAPAASVTQSAPAAPLIEETKTMQDSITDAVKDGTAQATDRAQAVFGDINARAKDAMAKGNEVFGEINALTKGNIEAIVESSKIAAKGAEEIARYTADYGRKTIEQANENAKRFASIKSPTELFQLQSEIAKGAVESFVAESSKFTENYLKLLGEIAQPISNRVAVTVEKVKLAA